MIFSVI